jgi:hypothetical protein
MKNQKTLILIAIIATDPMNPKAIVFDKYALGINKIILEVDPILIKFEFIVFQRNFVLINEGLLEIDFSEFTFEVIDDGIFGVICVEISIRKDILDFKLLAVKILEFLPV